MQKMRLKTELLKLKLKEQGVTQGSFADELGVSAQAVSAWFNNTKMPDPNNMQQICNFLNIGIKEAVEFQAKEIPQFKLPKTTTPKPQHYTIANAMSGCLHSLVDTILPDYLNNPLILNAPENNYEYIQKAATIIRQKLKIENEVINSIDLFNFINTELNAIVVPVIWGASKPFAEAMIYSIKNINFLYINVDSYLKDRKFWLLHEIGHIISPSIKNDYEESEKFANDLACAVLFPQEKAEYAIFKLLSIPTESAKIEFLKQLASKYEINVYTIVKSINHFEENFGTKNCLPDNSNLFKFISSGQPLQKLNNIPINEFIQYSKSEFKTNFFDYLKLHLVSNELGAIFIKKLLNVSMNDAVELFHELSDG